MKKLYKKGTVHPTPPLVSDQLLAFLPATILTLTAALSPEDKEVLAYLISCSSNNSSIKKKTTHKAKYNNVSGSGSGCGAARSAGCGADHPASFNCYCFRCYMSYWVRWDLSPNRQLIHEIIDAFEDGLMVHGKKDQKTSKRERRKSRGNGGGSGELSKKSELSLSREEFCGESSHESVEESTSSGGGGGGGDGEYGGGGEGEDSEKGSVRRFVNFLGERIWGAWA